MALAISLTTAQQMVVSILQASETPWASTVDQSNRQYSSDPEITNAILTADGVVCNVICNTIGHPYQNQFLLITPALTPGNAIPARNGIIVQVKCAPAPPVTFTDASVNTTNDTITVTGQTSNWGVGMKVWFSTAGSLPSPFATSTDYFIHRNSTGNAWQFATSRFNAMNGSAIDITTTGSGTSTITPQYEVGSQALSKEEIDQVNLFPTVYGSTFNDISTFWFIEGDNIYSPAWRCQIYYTDYELTSSPQAPQPYLNAVVCGALGMLLKDGGDANMLTYYNNLFTQYLEMVRAGQQVIPAITAYKMPAKE